ncbi:RNA ligase/cyclic nucleotide phosphodiesterase [Xylariomycetidae sp. FL0641]|nr:RNA ligase/cyclic nucleotide phosphodiesterase [Xylariomycetidae sp. FL0641]
MGSVFRPAEARNKLEDLTGVVLQPGENPYNALIKACDDNPTEVQALYAIHRSKRNAQQKNKFLDAEFKELIIDPYLLRLENPRIEPGFKDTRHCMTFWARPPIHILILAEEIQRRLKLVAPNLWLMPSHRMHLTTLELAFSRTAEEIHAIVEALKPAIPTVAGYTYRHRARLVKPQISYDLSALAVSFLPASVEPGVSPIAAVPNEPRAFEQDDNYTYHHLRRDLWNQVKDAGMAIDSRYVVPSAHITLGRYLTQEDHATPEQRKEWVGAIDEVNKWLEDEVWGAFDGDFLGEWVVGHEKGLDIRVGTLWYGHGRTVLMGEGF